PLRRRRGPRRGCRPRPDRGRRRCRPRARRPPPRVGHGARQRDRPAPLPLDRRHPLDLDRVRAPSRRLRRLTEVDARFESVGPEDVAVRSLYADFIREADGPLRIDLEAEIAAGPPPNLAPPDGALLLARVDGDPAGLGGVRHLDTPIAEVKSMYVVRGY